VQDNTHEVLLSAPLKGSMYTIRRLDMNCARPEDSHGECRESAVCRARERRAQADESGVVPLVWLPLHAHVGRFQWDRDSG
jgi:hypothetical protein